MPRKNGVETGLDHDVHQVFHPDEIHTRFGGQGKGMAAFLLPFGDHGQELRHLAFVTDEVVVNQKEGTAPSQFIQMVELRNHLFRAFRARHTTVQLRDVAELTVERATPRELQTHRIIIAHIDEVEARQRSCGHIRPARGAVDSLCRTVLQVAKERRKGLLHLI